MYKRYGVIFFLLGFLFFSFSGSICLLSKLNAEQVTEILGNLAEEEDETSKEDGCDTDALLEMFDQIASRHIQLEHDYLSHPVDPLPLFDPNTFTPPPKA